MATYGGRHRAHLSSNLKFRSEFTDDQIRARQRPRKIKHGKLDQASRHQMAGQCGDAARSASAAVLTSPDHLWSIFAALPAKYLVTACRVCRQWRDVERENEEALWRPLCSQLALLRGAKERQYESSARLARLSFKRQCRVLHSNLHSHIRQTRSPNTVLNNDYKFEVEVDNAGRNAFHGIAETRTVE